MSKYINPPHLVKALGQKLSKDLTYDQMMEEVNKVPDSILVAYYEHSWPVAEILETSTVFDIAKCYGDTGNYKQLQFFIVPKSLLNSAS